MILTDIQQELIALKPLLSEKFKVKSIGVFGSYASGHQTTESDIDIVVELEEPLGWSFFDLKEFLESKFNRPVDLVTKNALKTQLSEQILSRTKFV